METNNENKKDFITWIEEDALPETKLVLFELKLINASKEIDNFKAINEVLVNALKRFMIVYERKSNIDKLGWNSAYSEAKAILDKHGKQ